MIETRLDRGPSAMGIDPRAMAVSDLKHTRLLELDTVAIRGHEIETARIDGDRQIARAAGNLSERPGLLGAARQRLQRFDEPAARDRLDAG